MKTSLVNTVWFSEKRKNLLLLLYEGNKDIEQIKKALNVTSRSIMPQIKILKKENLVFQEGENFYLSNIGEIITKNMLQLLDTSRIIDENKDYWISRDLEAIPPNLFNRIRELGHYFLIEPDINHLFELPREFMENIPKSNSITTFASYLHPGFVSLYSEVAHSGVKITLVLTSSAFEKLKSEYSAECASLMESKHTNILLLNGNPKIPMITVTDWFGYICLFNKEGRYDHKDIISFDDSALKWCQDFFDYYKNNMEHANHLKK